MRGPEKTMFPSCDFALPVSTVSELSAMSHPESLLWDVGLDSDTTFNVFFKKKTINYLFSRGGSGREGRATSV